MINDVSAATRHTPPGRLRRSTIQHLLRVDLDHIVVVRLDALCDIIEVLLELLHFPFAVTLATVTFGFPHSGTMP